jgi:MoxR-like ATPase
VTVDGVTRDLKPPFLVIATQNPIDTRVLSRCRKRKLDRFLMRFSLGYPNLEDEARLLGLLQRSHPLDSLETVVSAEEF